MEYYFTGQTNDGTNRHRNTSSAPSYEINPLLPDVEMESAGNSEQPAAGESFDQNLRSQYTEELKQVEEEIKTLQQVLTAKYTRQHFLRRKLGITAISELREEVRHGIENLRTSDAYLRATSVMNTAKDKTTASIQENWSLIKSTKVFKALEDKVVPAYASVRNKLTRGSAPNVHSVPDTSSASQDVELTEKNAKKEASEARQAERPGRQQTSDGDTRAGTETSIRSAKVPSSPPDPLDDLEDDDTEELKFVNPQLEIDERAASGVGQARPGSQKQNAKRSSNRGSSS